MCILINMMFNGNIGHKMRSHLVNRKSLRVATSHEGFQIGLNVIDLI